MHSRIIQIADTPIEKEDFLDEDTIEVGSTTPVDYTDEISEEERQLAINNLVNYWLPKGMFSFGTEPDTIVYNGGIEEWREEWVKTIKDKAMELTGENVFHFMSLYNMQRTLDNALDIGTLFYLSEHNFQSYAERSTAFMEYVNGYSAGQMFYIGGVLDYHW